MAKKTTQPTFNVGDRVSYLSYEVFTDDTGRRVVSDRRKKMTGTVTEVRSSSFGVTSYTITPDPGQTLVEVSIDVIPVRDKMTRV